jgi:pentatricopeptide repeat protein
MLAFAKNKDVETVERLFQEVKKQGIVLNKMIFNSLIMVYAKTNQALKAEQIMDEMRQLGLTPDVITFTTVIDAYKRIKNYEKVRRL